MTMMCVTSLVTASKERQIGAKSCKAGKLHSADEIISFTLDKCEYRSARRRTSLIFLPGKMAPSFCPS
jgi:hypothetical protein